MKTLVLATSALIALNAMPAHSAPAAPAAPGAPGGPSPLEAAPSRFATLGPLRIHYKTLEAAPGAGAGPALVLVHGWTCDLEFWKNQASALTKRGRVILLDLPGHGQSSVPDEASIDLFSRAVEAVRKDAGAEPVIVIGHSMGTLVGRHVLRLFPATTMGLLAVDGSLRPPGNPRERETFLAPFRGSGYRRAAGSFIDAMLGPGVSPGVATWVKKRMLATPQKVALSAMESAGDPAYFTSEPVRVPLGVLVASGPYWKGYDDFIRSLNPEAVYRELRGAGHFLMLERPAETSQFLGEILDAMRAGAPPAARPTR